MEYKSDIKDLQNHLEKAFYHIKRIYPKVLKNKKLREITDWKEYLECNIQICGDGFIGVSVKVKELN